MKAQPLRVLTPLSDAGLSPTWASFPRGDWTEDPLSDPEDPLVRLTPSSCGLCRALREDLLAFEARAGERDPRLVLVCMGDAQAMRADGFRSLVLLDAGGAAAALFGVRGTPMAVLVDADGRIASPPVAGAAAVLALATAGRGAPPAPLGTPTPLLRMSSCDAQS